MLKHLVLISSIFTLLTACGGGGGGGSKSPSTPPTTVESSSASSSSLSSSSSSSSSISSSSSSKSSSSSSSISSSSSSSTSSSSSSKSSSSSSSASSVNPCNNTSGTIFSECLNTTYGVIWGAQYVPSYIEYTESKPGQQVEWSILESNSTHNKVLDVSFTDNARKGQLVIGHPDISPATLDESQFQTGSLQFDLRVLNFGDAYNAQAGGVVFATRMDCLWPCSSHEAQILIPTLDTWTHVSLPISDFIASGLDITKVNNSLVLVPFGSQANLHIQLDNVQFSKGGSVVTGPKVIFKEDFNNKAIPEWTFTNVAGNPNASATTSYGFGATLMMLWQGANNAVRVETTLDKSIDITNKKASFQMICWKNSSMNFSFQMISTDINGATEATDANYATMLKTETWYNVFADFGNVFEGGYDPKHINKVGLQFTYLGSPADSTYCQIDTIRITE